jgi:hypothetical protein
LRPAKAAALDGSLQQAAICVLWLLHDLQYTFVTIGGRRLAALPLLLLLC